MNTMPHRASSILQCELHLSCLTSSILCALSSCSSAMYFDSCMLHTISSYVARDIMYELCRCHPTPGKTCFQHTIFASGTPASSPTQSETRLELMKKKKKKRQSEDD